MKASRGHRDLERRFEGHAEGQGHEEMAGRLETVSGESEERQKHVDELPVSNNAPPQYECYFNSNNNINNNNP